MPLAVSLFPDLDGLDGLIADSEIVFEVYFAALLLMLLFVVGNGLVEYFRRSPVERLLRKRGRA